MSCWPQHSWVQPCTSTDALTFVTFPPSPGLLTGMTRRTTAQSFSDETFYFTIYPVFFSATGGLLFSFGSVLSWAVIRSFLRQDQNLLATILGLGSGFLITKMTIDYVNLVDSKVVKCEPRN